MMQLWALAWRNLWRDARAGELRLPMVAVALGVAALSSVAFLADRMQAGMARDARQLMGGDVVVVSDQPTPAAFVQKAKALGLNTATTLSFPTMARARDEDGGASKLVAFKSVSAGYPLRGNLSVAEGPGLNAALTREIPAPGTVWVEAALLDALGLEMGQPLLLGDASLRVSKIIVSEPDRGGGFISFSPRVMLNQADVAATGLVQPSSRSTYRLAVAGEDRAVKAYIAWTTQVLDKNDVRGLRIESLDSGRPEMRLSPIPSTAITAISMKTPPKDSASRGPIGTRCKSLRPPAALRVRGNELIRDSG
jgi:putative ABC transport system permease protein